jgi:hypothetical protein
MIIVITRGFFIIELTSEISPIKYF